jgi:hypothetical protein
MARANTGVSKVNIYLSDDVLDVMRRLAHIRGCAYSELIREACRRFALVEGPQLLEQQKKLKEMNGG